jgi:hypothetical protein
MHRFIKQHSSLYAPLAQQLSLVQFFSEIVVLTRLKLLTSGLYKAQRLATRK